jgi:K+-transporting ATPase KdpF subunit
MYATEKGWSAMIENSIILTLAIALMVYLVYALLRPEKF